jgi:hypothetical protein
MCGTLRQSALHAHSSRPCFCRTQLCSSPRYSIRKYAAPDVGGMFQDMASNTACASSGHETGRPSSPLHPNPFSPPSPVKPSPPPPTLTRTGDQWQAVCRPGGRCVELWGHPVRPAVWQPAVWVPNLGWQHNPCCLPSLLSAETATLPLPTPTHKFLAPPPPPQTR